MVEQKTKPKMPWGLIRWKQKKAKEADDKVLNFLNQNDGYCPIRLILKTVSKLTIRRMVLQQKLVKIDFNLSRGAGNYKRFSQKNIFNEGYFPYTFVCLNRSSLVRLLMKAVKKPINQDIHTILTHYLKRHLTEAERFAVLWKLGIRQYSPTQVKQSIQIDGIMKARKIRVGV